MKIILLLIANFLIFANTYAQTIECKAVSVSRHYYTLNRKEESNCSDCRPLKIDVSDCKKSQSTYECKSDISEGNEQIDRVIVIDRENVTATRKESVFSRSTGNKADHIWKYDSCKTVTITPKL